MAAGVNRRMRTEYMEGSAARRLSVERQSLRQRREEESRQRSIREQTRQNQEKALEMSISFVVFLAVASVAAVLICFQYLSLQTTISERLDNITALQEGITELKSDNKALELEIDSYYTLDYIYQVATELGMVYASDDQIIVYEKTESEYVRQYDDIPQ